MTTPSDSTQAQGLTPQGLAEQLFNMAIAQGVTDPRVASSQVIDFLGSSLFYAITSSKNDVIAFLAETLIRVVSVSAGDEAARKEMLKHIGDTIATAHLIPVTASVPVKP